MENEYVIINQDSWRNEYQGSWDRVSSSSSYNGVSNRLDALEKAVEILIAENARLKKIMETPSWEEAVKTIEEKP
jgi:hypothetical protein